MKTVALRSTGRRSGRRNRCLVAIVSLALALPMTAVPARGAQKPEQLVLRIRAFIPQKRIQGPNLPAAVGCKYDEHYYYYGGDGRSYDPMRGTSRVQLDVGMRWDGAARFAGYYASVGKTHVYARNGALVSERQASATHVWAKRLGGSRDRLDIRVNIQAKNPYCKMGYIEGVFTITFYRDGSWWIRSGGHRAMPNWEIYTKWNFGKYRLQHRAGYTGASCLAWKIEICQQYTLGGLVGEWK